MTLLDLIPGLKRVSTTGGGEWAGPCPACGGNDRFRVWPDRGTTGRYWCRVCDKKGDGIQFIRDRDGLTFPEALRAWGLSSTIPAGHRSGRATREPRQATAPGIPWQEKAASFLTGCQKNLVGSSGDDCREWLTDRGLSPETINDAGLGWNPLDQYQSRESWGLPPEMKDGKPRRVWMPRGLVIPCFAGGQLVRLRIRRPNPGDGPRYVIVSGSSLSPLTLGHGMAWVIVESELDALLLAQEAGDLAGVIALGSAQARPDPETDRALKEAGLILVSLDSDRTGAKEAWHFWKQTYPTAKRWPCPVGKDPTEAKQEGLPLRAWVMAGLPEPETKEPTKEDAQSAQTPHQELPQAMQGEKTYKDKGSERRTVFEPFPAEWKERFDEETLERLAIMTTDGGLTDLEALELVGRF